jgi:hypothetical protein
MMKNLKDIISERLILSKSGKTKQFTADDLSKALFVYKSRNGINSVSGVNLYKLFGDFNDLPEFNKTDNLCRVCYIGADKTTSSSDDIVFAVYYKKPGSNDADVEYLNYHKDDYIDFIDDTYLEKIIKFVNNR